MHAAQAGTKMVPSLSLPPFLPLSPLPPSLSLLPLPQAGTPVKDVELPDNPARKTLLLDKHVNYIEAFERDKDDFVCTWESIYD